MCAFAQGGLPQSGSARSLLDRFGHRFVIFLLALGVAGLGLASVADAEVGAIAGSFAVTPNGGVAYSIPLIAPGGINGLAPSLALVYGSDIGQGLVGWGATVAGISKVTRCPSTFAIDQSTAPVNLTSRDMFCLDGQELSVTSGTYGQDGALYETTPTAHLQIISHTSHNDLGPDWFAVQHPDGTVYEYGRYYNSVVIDGASINVEWDLDKITDSAGNSIQFHYSFDQANLVTYLSWVEWTYNSSNSGADHSLNFTYENAPSDAVVDRYLGGDLMSWVQRLTKITYKYNGANQISYTIGYLDDGQGSDRSRINTVTECDTGGNCLPVTGFQWQQGASGYADASDTGQNGPVDDNYFMADLNGDGIDDIVYVTGGVWRVRFGQTSGGFGSQHSLGLGAFDESFAQPIHFYPGAADQLLAVKSGNSDWVVVSWDPDSQTASTYDTGITADGYGGAAADVNGDGLDDLVTADSLDLYVYLNQGGPQTQSSFGSRQTAYTITDYEYSFVSAPFRGIGAGAATGAERRLNFQGVSDGVVLREMQTINCNAGVDCPGPFYSDQAFVWDNGSLVAYGSNFTTGLGAGASGGAVVPLDVNGDGLTDLVNGTNLHISTGLGFSGVTYGGDTTGLSLDEEVAADYNGDGNDDLLIPDSSTGDWMLLESTGAGFGDPVDTGVSSADFGDHPEVGDTRGRGLLDLVGVNSAVHIERALRNGPYPDLVTQVSDGQGNYESPAWSPAPGTTLVTASATVNYPFEVALAGGQVVASVTRNDGVGSSYTTDYQYDTPERYASVGPGFVGFRSITSTDGRDGHKTISKWVINPYHTHLISEITREQANGNPISDDAYQYTGQFGINKGTPVRLASLTTTRYDTAGNPLYTVKRQYGYDSVYNVNSIDITTTDSASGDVWESDTSLTLANSMTSSDWCVGLPSETDVTDTTPDNSQTTRTNTYDPDTSSCRENSVTTNQATANISTKTAYTYDPTYGYVTAVKVTGHNFDGSSMSTRTTQYNYYVDGEYPSNGEYLESVTDPVSDVVGYAWNGAFALKASETAPNGSVTGYSYDSFGRPTGVTYPTGGYETVTWTACGQDDCGFAAGAYYAVDDVYEADGTASGASRVDYDRYGRVIATLKQLGGGWAEFDRTYDALGRVASQSAPYYSGDTTYATSYTYDALGRIATVAAPASAGQERNVHYSYDGLVTTMTEEANGAATVTTRDPLGEITDVEDAGGGHTTYDYGPFNVLTRVTGPGPNDVQSNVQYDGAGYRTSVSAPDLGTVAVALQPDSLGEVTQKTDGASTINYQYDKLGRMTQEDPGNPDLVDSWSYSHSGNNAGRLYLETKGSSFTENFYYNNYGEPTQDKQTYDGTAWAINYGYDTLGRVASVEYPTTAASHRLQVDYGYDTNGQLASATDDNDDTVYWQVNTNAPVPVQNAWGETQAWILGSGADVQRSYDGATGAITGVTAGPNGSSTIANLGYTYDALGNTATTADHIEQVYAGMTNDDLNRLQGELIVSNYGNVGGSMGYSGDGNVTSRTGVGTYTYGENGAPPHAVTSITNGSTYTYDNSTGRMTSGGGFTDIHWNPYGLPTEIDGNPSLWLGYTADRALLTKTVYGQSQWRYFGNLFVQQGSDGWRERIFVGGEAVAIVSVTSAGFTSVEYLVHDSLGSPSVVTDSAGNVTGRLAYDAWGDLVNPAKGWGTDPNASSDEALTTIGYTGHEEFWEQGLVHTYARVYMPGIGRWMSPDPTVPDLYNGQSLNRYSYVLNDPTTFMDPTGLCKEGPDCVNCPDDGAPWCPVCIACQFTDPGNYQSGITIGPGGRGTNPNQGRGPDGVSRNPQQSSTKSNCGSSQGIPPGEGLTPAAPAAGIFNGSSTTLVSDVNGTQLQVGLTNISGFPLIALVDVKFQLAFTPYVTSTPLFGVANNTAPINLGDSGPIDVYTNTTSVVRSQPYGPGPLSLKVTIDVENDANVAATFCSIGAQ